MSAPPERTAGNAASRSGAARRFSAVSAADALLGLMHIDGAPAPSLSETEWRRVVALAAREQVTPLVLAAIQARPLAVIPEAARAALEHGARRAAAHVPAAYDQAVDVLKSLRSAGVAPVLIKGVALAQFVYPDRGLRPFHDLDVLVGSRDREAAARALTAEGYVTGGCSDHALEAAGEQTFWDPSWRRAPVDVHWRFDVAPVGLGLDYEEIFRRACAATIHHEPVQVLSPADTIVALSAWFLNHLWGGQPRLRYLRDIAEVARRCHIDWDIVLQTAVRAPMTRSPVRNALTAAARLLGAAVPAQFIAQIAPSRGLYLDRGLTTVTCRRILRRQTWPFPAVVQVAAMRWLDGDAWTIYPQLGRAVAGMRWRRMTAAKDGSSRYFAWPTLRPG